MATLYVDIETYSTVDLRKSSAYRYVEDPKFQILMAAWAIDDGPVHLELDDPLGIPGLFDDSVEKVAHNAAFERICFSAASGLPVGEYLDPAHWTDTMALAAENGYPMSLGTLAEWVTDEKKDSAGTRLISLFCRPNRKGQRTLPEEKPQEWESFKEYCRQDVVTLRAIHRELPDWPTQEEWLLHLADQEINDRGIAVDTELVEAAIEAAEDNRMDHELEMTAISGVLNPASTQQLTAWFAGTGLELPNLQAETVEALLTDESLTPEQHRMLELRKELALVASKKYSAARDRVNSDGRLRGSFQFFGAHTGRWAGRGVQLQNLPAASITPEDEEVSVDTAIEAHVLDVKMGMGATSHDLKALVRSMFTGPFTVVDYSAIEARVVAWIANEEWALRAFAGGRDIYVETAERMGGLTRKEGKVAVLALGYNGGPNSLRAMGAEGSESYMKALVTQWREANPNIVQLWAEMDSAFWTGGWAGDMLHVETDGDDRLLRLPSGRAIVYHGVKRKWATNRWGNRSPQLSFRDPKRSPYPMGTYGGRLVENATQAIARDVLAHALRRLNDLTFRVVGHVHDEILVEGDHSVDKIAGLMTESAPWMKGLPLAAEGYVCRRYRKD